MRHLIWALIVAVSLLGQRSHALGILVCRVPQERQIELGPAEVQVQVRQNLAKTRVIQEFFNPNPRQLEADFYFPVPRGANVTDFVMFMDGKAVRGEVLEREKAREIYEGIVRQMKDPGLVEWMDYDLFKLRVFPVPANGTQKIELEFAQPLEADQGLFRYSLPLKSVKGGPAPALKFNLEIVNDDPVRNVYSPSHPIEVDAKDPKHVRVTAPAEGFGRGAGDFLLFYELSNRDVAASLLARRQSEKDGFFSLMLSPPLKTETTATQKSDVVFVIDTSGSMMDDNKIEQARRALAYCVSQLQPEDRFNLVRFSTEVEAFEDKLLPATPEAKERAKNWIGELNARGGTNISEALKAAMQLRDDAKSTGSRIFTTVFLTDGLPTVGITDPQRIISETLAASGSNVRIFTFGVGNDVNTRLLDELAEETRAASDYLRPEQDMEVPVSRFFDKISRPALTGLKLDIPGAEVFDVYPKNLPDLFYGTQLTVFGRYKKAGATAIKLSGTRNGEPVELLFEKTLPEQEEGDAFVEKLWATRKIAYLLDEIRKAGESREVKDEVISLGKKYGIVTPYTSYLVTEDKPAVAAATPAVPGLQRRGWPSAPVPMAAADSSRQQPEESNLFWRFGESESAARSASAPSAGAPASSYAADSVLKSESGKTAVGVARRLRSMKEADSVSQEAAIETLQTVGSWTFSRNTDGMWIDTTIQGGEDTTLKVKYLSPAYFALLDRFPELREIFALGTKIRVKMSKGILEVNDDGIENIRLNQMGLLGD